MVHGIVDRNDGKVDRRKGRAGGKFNGGHILVVQGVEVVMTSRRVRFVRGMMELEHVESFKD